MLNLNVNVVKGVMVINLEGDLNIDNFNKLDLELNNLIYKQGMHYYIFNFRNLNQFDSKILNCFQNKVVEIFLNCGNIVMCGLNSLLRRSFGFEERLIYVNNEKEAFECFSI